MAFLDEEFDVETIPVGTGSFEPLPAGWFTATIRAAEVKSTKAGDGKYIAVRYTITGPTHQGRVVFGNLNIKNPSTKAEEIGRQQLGEIMRAIGLSKVTDSDQLIGGNLSIKLEVKTGDYAGNEVKGYKATNAGIMGIAEASMQLSSASAAPAKAAPPWARKQRLN